MLFALVDCNNFYASCERLFRPDLARRPIVVLSNNDGCIVSRSAEAKALGIPMGEPEFKARAFLKKHHVAVFSSNYALYGDISQRVMNTLESLVPRVEQYSIDEAFLRLDSTLVANAADMAACLRQRVWQWTGIQVSVGIAPTRTLAKIASSLAKKSSGICCMGFDIQEQERLLQDFPVEAVWGIGRKQAAKCRARALTTALHLKEADDLWLKQHLTISGLQTALELRGIACLGMSNSPPPRKTLVSSRSFGSKVKDRASLEEALSTFAARAGERLRRAGLVAAGMTVHIRTSRHVEVGYLDKCTQILFTSPTADTLQLIKAVQNGLDSLYSPGYEYAKAGVMLFGLEALDHIQGNLLSFTLDTNTEVEQNKRTTNGEKPRRALHAALDAINYRYGKQTLVYGAEGATKNAALVEGKQAPWHMRQQYRSPRATTNWDELPQAKLK